MGLFRIQFGLVQDEPFARSLRRLFLPMFNRWAVKVYVPLMVAAQVVIAVVYA